MRSALAICGLASSCAGSYSLPENLASELLPIDVKAQGRFWVNGKFDLFLAGNTFIVDPYMQTEEKQNWFPRSQKVYDRRTSIWYGNEWVVRCQTTHKVGGGFHRGGEFGTVELTTRCTGEGAPAIDLLMEDWPRVDGFVTAGKREYSISASPDRKDRAIALLVQRGSVVYLVLAADDRVWIRSGLDRDEEKILLQVAAALWTSTELRAI